jgi:hypothetical protein
MPLIWLHLLLDEKIVDKAETLMKLKYEYTVDDVYDLLEFLEVQDFQLKEIQKSKEKDDFGRDY